jgi:hypothetical protein
MSMHSCPSSELFLLCPTMCLNGAEAGQWCCCRAAVFAVSWLRAQLPPSCDVWLGTRMRVHYDVVHGLLPGSLVGCDN